jgi:hypothetical protein
VTVSVGWEPGTLRVAVANPAGHEAAPGGGGHGLPGLGERARAAGGRLEHGLGQGEFRLVATLPAVPVAAPEPSSGIRTAALGFAVAALMFVVVPASMLLGVR